MGRRAVVLLLVMSGVLLVYVILVDIADYQDLQFVAFASAVLLIFSALLLAWLRRRASRAPTLRTHG